MLLIVYYLSCIFDHIPYGKFQGPVHAYVAIPGGKTCYLSELKAGKEVIVVDQNGQQQNAIVGRVKIETRPLILVEAKACNQESRPLLNYIRRILWKIFNFIDII